MIKFKTFIKSNIYIIAKFFKLINQNYYKIDGGLGSQIISFLIFTQAKESKKKVFCDVHFFDRSPNDILFLSNTYRTWKLDNYGISIDDIKYNSQIGFFDKFKLKPDEEYFGKQFENFMKNYNQNLNSLIPNLGLEKEILNYYNINNTNYTVIHIRKGDFLKQSSYLVEDKSYIKLLNNLKCIFTQNIFIISDEKLENNFISEIKLLLNNFTLIFEFSRTDIQIHSLMRSSKILITSNSMFSLSAGILRPKNLLTITPKIFFGKEFYNYNNGINSLSDWNILS